MAICGVACEEAGSSHDAEIERALDALSLNSRWKRQRCSGGGFAFGVASATGSAAIGAHGCITVCCDAELWNAPELYARAGVTDENPALAIAILYEQLGEQVVHELRGAFALAIRDDRESTLLLAVDPTGIRPLAFNIEREAIRFASQPRGILATGRVRKEVNHQAIASYLTFTVVPAPDTAFRGIRKLEPGTLLRWSGSGASERRYWDVAYTEDARESPHDLAARLLERMRASVAASAEGIDHARLGCFLSGGTDSSSVVGLLSQFTREPANTFSIGFQEDAFNELHYAHVAVRHFGARHREATIDAAAAFETVNQIVGVYDEPFGNASVIPAYHCMRLAREAGMSTMLAGDGGDELFGGNERYRTDQLFQMYFRLPGVARKGIEAALFRMPDSIQKVGRLKRYVNACNQGNPERYCAWLLTCRYPAADILGDAILERDGPNGDNLAIVRRHYETANATSELNRLLYIDMKMTLADNDLPKVMRAAEMLDMRVRFPYLDRSLVEFAGTLPANLKVHGLEKRYLFKKATTGLLPREILTKKKHGFGLPVGLWLKTDPRFRSLARDVLLDPRTYERGYFRRPFVERMFRDLEADDGVYFGDSLWLFLMLELWHRKHVEGNA